ncbi:MAG: hypothetical protein EXS08_03665 [Planctomycetes bacterium]|nr:hypothetical protein [Planctomycetota bacterium]
MVSRPAFIDRILSRFPDPFSLRVQTLGWTGALAGSFGVLLVVATTQLDARRCAEVARARAETLALTAGTWLDGDAHAGLGQEPEKRLSDLGSTLAKLLEASEFDGTVRTLRPTPAYKAELAEKPQHARPGALEVVIQSGTAHISQPVDYRPEMAAALFEGHVATVLADGRVSAYAPVPDSWGSAPALVWVETSAVAPLWRRIVFPLSAALFTGLLVSFAVYLARRHASWYATHAAVLAAGAEQLRDGHMSGSVALAPRAPSELARVAEALEELRMRSQSGVGGQAPSSAEESELEPEVPAHAALGEPSEFDLGLLLQQLIDPARKNAQARGVDVQLVFPDNLPPRLSGHPLPLFRALDGLLRNSLRTTREGQVTLRVSRAGDGAEGLRLRFEVADTSPGIAFREQQELVVALAEAAQADPAQLTDSLQLASAFACALGSELAFESQPGQGSRFGFTSLFQANEPSAPTAFQPRTATAFTPEPRSPFPSSSPHGIGPPISSFTPRQSMRLR